MTIMTIEQVAAEHARLGAIIAALQTPAPAAPTLLLLPETSIELHPGERYAGPVLNEHGLLSHHLVLLPGDADDLDWTAAKQWAKEAGGELPTRQEQALLFANLKSEFEGAYYWSSEEYSSSYAWNQGFYHGLQYYLSKSAESRARAVRRFTP